MTTAEQPETGKVRMRCGDDCKHSLHSNAIAYRRVFDTDDELYVLSVAGPAAAIKATNAALLTDARTRFTMDIPGHGSHNPLRRPRDTKYRIRKARLGQMNTWHLLAIADVPGLIPNLSEDAVWRALMSEEITTPLLRKWLPYVTRQLRALDHLEKLLSWGCQAALLTADSDDVDDIVSRGLRDGEIAIS